MMSAIQMKQRVSAQQERASRVRKLHHIERPLVIGNAWDAASARILELAGFRAIGTTSAGIAFSRGYPDGQRIPADLMVAAVAEICRVTSVPVTADLEAGYGNSPEEIERTTTGVIQAGAVGMNLEDGTGNPDKPLTDLALQVEKLTAVKRGAAKLDIDLVLNARTDAYLYAGSAAQKFEETLRRARSYVSAGADCVFIIGMLDKRTISAFVKELEFPINVIIVNSNFTVSELRDLGVARVSFGSGPMRAGLTLLQRFASEILAQGTSSTLSDCISHAEMNKVMQFPCSTPQN
jgi:2-methylisocitrate lyase-like PEP mutase family enzyme